jgi:hypothetical protein
VVRLLTVAHLGFDSGTRSLWQLDGFSSCADTHDDCDGCREKRKERVRKGGRAHGHG